VVPTDRGNAKAKVAIGAPADKEFLLGNWNLAALLGILGFL
jgi:hypothetical protein